MPAGISTIVSSPEDWIVASSCAITVSRPAGITAPVMILTHSPDFTLPCQALPANAVPTTRNVNGEEPSCLPSKAKPSMAELSCAGTLMGEMMSSDTIRPKAFMSGSSSVAIAGSACTKCWINSCALSTLKACGSKPCSACAISSKLFMRRAGLLS